MNFFNALKSAKDFVETSAEVYNAIRSSIPFDNNKTSTTFEKAALTDYNPLENGNSSLPFRIFIPKKASKNSSPTYHVIQVDAEVVALKSANLDEAKRTCSHLNNFSDLARACVENHLTEKFLTLTLANPSWQEVHLACALGIPAYVREICNRGDALSLINAPTRQEGLFPLHLAAERGFVRLIDLLLGYEADVLKTDLTGRNALHFAVCASDHALGADVLDLIAKKRPDIFKTAAGKRCQDGLTPFRLAFNQHNVEASLVFLRVDKQAARQNVENLFTSKIDARCLGVLLEADNELLKFQTETSNVLHRPFTREVLTMVAEKAPFALELRLGSTLRTPLHAACARADLNAVVALLSFGADVNALDNAKNTMLHFAANANALRVTQLLICFNVDLRMKNADGKIASELAQSAELINLFNRVSNWNVTRDCTLKPKNAREMRQFSAISSRLAASATKRKNCVRLLTLDGGGIRGIVLIQTLLEIEERLGSDVLDYFDWLAGTSTGAILALALADGTSLRDCLRLYLRLKDEVFSHKTEAQTLNESAVSTNLPSVSGSPVSPQQMETRIRLYSAEKIEHFLQKQFGANRTMSELKKKRVVVTATCANVNPPELILYRSYAPPPHLDEKIAKNFQDPRKMTIWKAARCSSAAPTYFPSVDGTIMDGGLVANNPALDLLADVQLYNSSLFMDGEEEQEIACLVSLGTGKMPPKTLEGIDVGIASSDEPTFGAGIFQNLNQIYRNFTAIQNLKTILVEQVACSDGHVVERARAWAHSLRTPYFRLTPQLTQDVPLDATDNTTLVGLLWTTKVYLNEECKDHFDSLIYFLRKHSE